MMPCHECQSSCTSSLHLMLSSCSSGQLQAAVTGRAAQATSQPGQAPSASLEWPRPALYGARLHWQAQQQLQPHDMSRVLAAEPPQLAWERQHAAHGGPPRRPRPSRPPCLSPPQATPQPVRGESGPPPPAARCALHDHMYWHVTDACPQFSLEFYVWEAAVCIITCQTLSGCSPESLCSAPCNMLTMCLLMGT